MSRVMVAVNSLTSIKNQAYASHCQEWYRMARDFPYPEWQFVWWPGNRLSIDNFRNAAAQMALQAECSHLYFFDDDIILTPSTLKSLMNADKDIVMAQTFIRSYPFEPMYFRIIDGQIGPMRDWKEHVDENGLIKVDAIGCSCVLIKCDVLLKMDTPYFVTTPGLCTEDVYFCNKAKRFQPDLTVYVDTKVPTGHMMDEEVVHVQNVEKLRERCREDNPHIVKAEKYDRGAEYLTRLKEIT